MIGMPRRLRQRRVFVAALGCAFALHWRQDCSSAPLTAFNIYFPFDKTATAKQVVDRYAQADQLEGKVAIVTGGNSGIGAETVKALASAGCRVILASRSAEAGEKTVKEEIVAEGVGGYAVSDGDIVVKPLDLANLSSVVAFADDLLASEQRIDYLVLNAGVMATPELERTEDGFEKQIGVNHFGHALLVRLLLPTLENQGSPSRIVSVASTAHSMAERFDVSNLHYKDGSSEYSPWGAYGNSKLANVLFIKALARRLPTKITAVSVHPGVIRTPLWRSTPANNDVGGWLLGTVLADKSIPQGAATTVWACLATKVRTPGYAGAYLSDCNVGSLSDLAKNDSLQEELWTETDVQLDEALRLRGLGVDGKHLWPKELV